MKSALTIGNFDGVHRGHRALVESLLEWRRAHETARTVVLSFEPHPIEIIRPGTVVPRLTTTSEKTRLLQNIGVDEVRIVAFTTAFSQMSAKDFLENVIWKDLQPEFVSVGHNFYFGYNREGTPGKLLDWSRERGISAKIVDGVEADGEIISSTRIRKLIEEGQMNSASRLLGRTYSLTGEVIHGDKRGRTIGFPTANLLPQVSGIGARCIPANGVYLSAATVEGKTFSSVTNVGLKPTVQATGPLVIETHLLDFTGDLYGKQLTVEFRDRIRPERKFSGLQELKEQIQRDTDLARSRS